MGEFNHGEHGRHEIKVHADIHHHHDRDELGVILLTNRALLHAKGLRKAIRTIKKLKHSLEALMAGKAELDAALDAEDSAYAELISDIAALPQAEDLQAEVDRIVARAQQLRDIYPTADTGGEGGTGGGGEDTGGGTGTGDTGDGGETPA